jgi:hypothetical protein
MRVVWRLLLGAALTAGTGATAAGQSIPVGDVLEDYLRVLQLTGDAPVTSFSLRPALDQAWLPPAGHPWSGRRFWSPLPGWGKFRLSVAPIEAEVLGASAYPVLANDGALWQGKGLSARVAAGLTARLGPLRVTLRPELTVAQNLGFGGLTPRDTTLSPYSDPWYGRRLDRPQRFGEKAFWTLDPGQSSIRLQVGGFAGGVSTESQWWGPGMAASIVLSNAGPGLPHAFVGTERPVSIGIGRIEARWIWGRLAESDYFDVDPANDHRYLTGLIAAFAPKPLPGLSVGGSRLFYMLWPAGGPTASDLFLVYQGVFKKGLVSDSAPSGDDDRDQMITLFARWVLPEAGFEVYADWARNDHSWDLRDFLLQPEHAQAYTLGFQKVVPAWDGTRLRLAGEITHLELSKTLLDRATPTYYVHARVAGGYTHRGQLVGAAVGPGGNQQRLASDVFAPWGVLGLYLLRRVHDNDTYYQLRESGVITGAYQNDVEYTLGVRGRLFLGSLEVGGSVAWSRELNRYYEFRNDVTNWHGSVSLRVHLDRWLGGGGL